MRYFLLFLLAVLSLGCRRDEEKTSPTSPSVNVTVIQNNQSNNSGGSSPSPNNSCSGKPIVSTGVGFKGDSAKTSIKVGETAVMDTTPKDSNGTPVSVECGAPAQVAGWFAGPESVCKLAGDRTSYNPGLLGVSIGDCAVSVVVLAGVQASRSVPVQ